MQRRSTQKLEIGDIFAIDTPKGVGAFQYVGFDERLGELIGVFGFTASDEVSAERETRQSEFTFYTFFPLAAALRKRLVRKIGDRPGTSAHSPPMRAPGRIDVANKRILDWFVYENGTVLHVSDLSPEQRRFSPRGIMNDTLLIHRIMTGWLPENW
jgi:hypothetical protein